MNAQQLRNSILQEAIQGRLVPQDPNDEPASVLLERIREEKKRLVKEGKLKKKDIIELAISDEEIPFSIPNNWEWVKLGSITTILGGKRIPAGRKLTQENTGHIYIRVSDMKGETVSADNLLYVPEDIFPSISRYVINKEDVYITVAGTIGRIGKIPSELDGANLTENADRLIFSYLNQDWLIKFLQSPEIQSQIADVTTKVGQPKLAIQRIQNLILPLPPLAEQKRIVAKIEELLPKVEEYGKAQEALDKLNAELPDRLKKSVLQEAIEGRLVLQDPNDEPASVLLQKIREEKKRLVKEGKLKKKDLEEKPISEDEKPFDIPDSWEWVRLVNIGIAETGTTPSKSHPEYFGTFIPFLGPANMLNGQIVSETQGLSEIGANYGRIVPKGSILQVCIGGSIGKCAIVDKSVTFNQQINSITPLLCVTKFIYFVLQSDYFRLAIKEKSTGTATPIINRGNWEQLAIPLPPLAEQKRIVAKIEEVFKEIDKLK